jgi:hypothetical protein
MKINLNILLKKVISRLNIINITIILNSAFLTAKIALKMSHFLDVKSKYTAICLGRSVFNDDIKTMSEFSGQINYQIIPKTIFTAIFNYYLVGIIRNGIHTKYHKIKGYEKEQLKYKNYLDRVFDYLLKDIDISAVISANYVYAWQQEIAKICLERGIPFIVLQKEGVTAKEDYFDVIKTYTNNNFIGTKLLVYNDNLKNAFLKLKIKGLNDSAIETVGIPRFDKHLKIESNGQNLVFFSFYVIDKIRHAGLSSEVINTYKKNAQDFHIEVMKFASKNKKINVIIKTKDSERYLNYVVNLAKNNNYLGLNNLTITNSADTFNLIKNSKCIIGFNSLVLLEGMLANKTLISPDIVYKGANNYFDEHPGIINYAKNYHDIKNYFNKKNDAKLSLEKTNFLREHIYKTDGKSSVRAENSIIASLESF